MLSFSGMLNQDCILSEYNDYNSVYMKWYFVQLLLRVSSYEAIHDTGQAVTSHDNEDDICNPSKVKSVNMLSSLNLYHV